MRNNIHLHTEPIKAKKHGVGHRVWVYLLLLPTVLFTLSAFTFIPNPAQTPNRAVRTTLPLASQMSEMLSLRPTDDGCSDVVIPEGISLSGIRIYLNVCALQHLNAFVTILGAGAIGMILLLDCPECGPLITWIGTIVSGVTGGIDFLQFDAQGCSGVFLDIGLSGGIKVTPDCDNKARTP